MKLPNNAAPWWRPPGRQRTRRARVRLPAIGPAIRAFHRARKFTRTSAAGAKMPRAADVAHKLNSNFQNTMKLILLQDSNGAELPIVDCPAGVLSSRPGLTNFLRLYAGRVFGGREGRDWRICQNDRCLVPLSVNQLVTGPTPGTMDYGQQLVIK